MTLCLVEQLFRRKIGLSIDPHLVSSLIWPLLFQERHIPVHILQDIHLVRQGDPNGEAEDRYSVIGSDEQNIFLAPGSTPSIPRLAGDTLTTIGIVNKFRSIKNPIIRMNISYRDYSEYTRGKGWMPYMDSEIILEERRDDDMMNTYLVSQERKYGISKNLSPEEWTVHIKEQRRIDNDNINSYIETIIRNKSNLIWRVHPVGYYDDDGEPWGSLRFTWYPEDSDPDGPE